MSWEVTFGGTGGAGSTLANTHIFVGNASAVAADVAVSGDLTLANTGAFTVVSIGGKAVTLANSLTTVGNFALTLTTTATTNSTLPAGTHSLAPLDSPSFTTPALGVATATSLALGGATIGSNVIATPNMTLDGNGDIILFNTSGNRPGIYVRISGETGVRVGIDLDASDNGTLGWGPGGSSVRTAFIFSPGAGTFQYGAPDADTAPVAQVQRTQGVKAGGTSNAAGANFTTIVSPGKGTGVGGSWILQTSPAGSTGTTVNTPVTRLTATGAGNVVVGSAAIATNATDGFLYIPTCAGTPTGVPTTFTGRVPLIFDTSANELWIYDAGWLQPKTAGAVAIVSWQ